MSRRFHAAGGPAPGTLYAPSPGVHPLPRDFDVFTSALTPELTLHIGFLPEECVWVWEIRRAADQTVVASSWEEEWRGYATPAEAAAAAHARLRQGLAAA